MLAQDLKTTACCAASVPKKLWQLLRDIHPEVLDKFMDAVHYYLKDFWDALSLIWGVDLEEIASSVCRSGY